MSDYPIIDLSTDALLTTTRSVRKRLDLTKPVPIGLIRECLGIAVQAPAATTPGRPSAVPRRIPVGDVVHIDRW